MSELDKLKRTLSEQLQDVGALDGDRVTGEWTKRGGLSRSLGVYTMRVCKSLRTGQLACLTATGTTITRPAERLIAVRRNADAHGHGGDYAWRSYHEGVMNA